MDAYLTDSADRRNFDGPPALIVASSESAMARAQNTILASGLRIGAKLSVEAANDRIRRQGAAGAVWIELDEDCGGPLDDLLATVIGDVRDHRYAAVISANADMIDAVAARVDEPAVEVLVDPN